MDFSYYNNKNEKVRLDLYAGSRWSELNVQNSQLNSIFAKIDDGDGVISEEELLILGKVKIPSPIALIEREDGIKFRFEDINDGQTTSFGKLIILDKNGKEYQINYDLMDCSDRDSIDCQNVKQNVLKFLAQVSEESINALIENNVEEITFTGQYEATFMVDKDYYKKQMDANGLVVDIQEGSATIISPEFIPPERKYEEKFSIQREDDYKIDVQSVSEYSSVMTITKPSGESVQFEVQGKDRDEYYQWQLPKLKEILSSLPQDVLEDLTKELTGIKFMSNAGYNGQYAKESNVIAYNISSREKAPVISFVHELGHAIDNQKGTMFSKSPDFVAKFEKFKSLLAKFDLEMKNHALEIPEEFFASEYANGHYPEDKTSNNHIAEIERALGDFELSDDPDKRLCYQLFRELQVDVHNYINEARTYDDTSRADNKLSLLVQSEFKDIISEFNKYDYILCDYFQGQDLTLDIISTLGGESSEFESGIKFYEKISKNELTTPWGSNIDMPEELQKLFTVLVERLREVKANLK